MSTLRTRLITWYLSIVALTLVLFAALLYVMLSRSLHKHHDDELAAAASRLARAVAGTPATADALRLPLTSSDDGDMIMVRDTTGAVIFRSPFLQLAEPNIGREEALVHAATRTPAAPLFFSIELERSGPVRFICVGLETAPRAYLQLGRPLGDVRATLEATAVASVVLIPLVVTLTSFGGWVIAGRALAPIRTITSTLQAIQARDLSRRVEVYPADEELAELVSTLNKLLGRLESAFVSLRDFVADVSHQLQTPLTIIQGSVDVSLESTRSGDEYRRVLQDVGDAVRDMAAVIADLRALSLADIGPDAESRAPVDLSAALNDAAEIVQALAESKDVVVDVRIQEGLHSWGSVTRLKQILLNLGDNAVKHTPPEGRISIELRRERRVAVLTVSDTGSGIPAQHLPQIFNRFYRAPGAPPGASGSGLGLAIVKRIVEGHRGTIEVESRPGEGSRFTVCLPLAI